MIVCINDQNDSGRIEDSLFDLLRLPLLNYYESTFDQM